MDQLGVLDDMLESSMLDGIYLETMGDFLLMPMFSLPGG